jgi:hypothetical protein
MLPDTMKVIGYMFDGLTLMSASLLNRISALCTSCVKEANMSVCSISECAGTAVAKGVCPKHYMRMKRHGEDVVLKRGPKTDPNVAFAKRIGLFDKIGTRTQARQRRGIILDRKIQEILGEPSYYKEAMELAIRPNGSVNWSQFERIMVNRACMLIAALEDDPAPK